MGSDALCCGVYCRNTEKYHLIVSPPIKEEKKKKKRRKKEEKRKKNKKKKKTTALSIPAWSPTAVLTEPSPA